MSSDSEKEKNGTEFNMKTKKIIKQSDDDADANKHEIQEEGKKLNYPKSVFFIISNELCERFAYYGMRTVLAIYLQKKLRYDENSATVIFHSFVMMCYLFPIVGAVTADSYLGKFKTIVYLSVVYTIGDMVLAAASTSIFPIPQRELTMIGLILIAAGTGGIKPCVSAFGGDQFVVPQQERQLQQFFSVFYFAINIGSMLGTLVTPIIRQDVHCLGETTCFPLAFGLPAILMTVATIIFVTGKRLYVIKKPQGNIIVDVSKCIWYALQRKFRSKDDKSNYNHWMDYADKKFDKKLIDDIKIVLSIAVMLSPTIIFWALFEQQGSSWTFQASRMDGNLWSGVSIKPDQVHIINPFLILLLIPLFQKNIYPFLHKLHLLRTPLQKMSFGGILAASSFFISGFLEIQLQPSYAVLPKDGEAQLRIFNSFNCSISLKMENGFTDIVGPMSVLELKSLKVENKTALPAEMTIYKNNCSFINEDLQWSNHFSLTEKEAVSYLVYGDKTYVNVNSTGFDNIEKSDYGLPKLRVLYHISETSFLYLKHSNDKGNSLSATLNSSDLTITDMVVPSGKYSLNINDKELADDFELQFGAVYRLLITEQNGVLSYKLFTITPPNSIHMLWILPQLIVITLAEMFFSITGIEFAYMQAPNSMKSVTSSLWLLTTSFGNLVVVFISKLLHSDNRAIMFFSYGGLMLLVMAVFIWFAMRYEYVQIVSDDDEINTKGKTNEAFSLDNDENK